MSHFCFQSLLNWHQLLSLKRSSADSAFHGLRRWLIVIPLCGHLTAGTFSKTFFTLQALTSDQSSHHFTRKSLCNCCSLCRPDFSAGLVSWVFSPMNLFNFRFCPLTSFAAGSATVRNQIFFKGTKRGQNWATLFVCCFLFLAKHPALFNQIHQ